MRDGNQPAGGCISSYALGLLKKHRYGAVHSVFRSSLNIELEGELVHISSGAHPLSSFGMILDEQTVNELLGICYARDIVDCWNNMITIYSKKVCTISLWNLTIVNLKLPRNHVSKEEIINSGLFQWLCRFPFEEKCGLPMNGTTMQYIKVLKSGPVQRLGEAAAYFLGRGRGTTPAGDDFLWGYTLAYMWLGKEGRRISVYDSLQWRSTTKISQAYYRALKAGFVSEDWLLLCGHGTGGDLMPEVEDAVIQILNTGHTSGVDTLFGFTTGIYSIVMEEAK